MRLRAGLCALLVSGSALAADRSPAPYGSRPEVRAFVQEMVRRHGFVERELTFAFSRARRIAAALKAVAPPPAERARSWAAYRAVFVNDRRVEAGLEFWRMHDVALARASREYGVPEEVIVAIIGVETFYGRHIGRWRVIDTLTTLAFDYPPRAEFFRGELENYLLFARDSGTDVFSVRGSYAGAIGIPQFMPGSYLKFAVDFDGDGHVDLRDNPADAVGSVANFLKQHGWRPGEHIALPAHVNGTAHRTMLEAGIEPSFRLQDLKQHGVETRTSLALETPVALIDLETPGTATEYRLGLRNFYVLTRYNRSSFYAAAVADLAAALREAR
ncbi:MAG: lytic murein transglycosylase B [Betaproteobacteria bacterium]|nr:lytic murein transglycosylase B [Betaproteobacteria bacterium]